MEDEETNVLFSHRLKNVVALEPEAREIVAGGFLSRPLADKTCKFVGSANGQSHSKKS